MKTFGPLAVTAALLLAAAAASAQPGWGAGPGPGASAPCCGPEGQGRMGGRWGPDFTSGWSMMTPAERQEHQARMASMTNYDECQAYADQHHQQMVDRAKGKGPLSPQPHRDVCAGLRR